MTPATVQLALPVDPLDDNPGEAEQAAVEAAVEAQHTARAARASWAPACRCEPAPWPDRDRCVRCGHAIDHNNAGDTGRKGTT